MRLTHIASIAAVALFSSPVLVLAQDAPPPGVAEMRAACADDLQKLCPDLKGPERRDCMQKNADKLSQKCKDAQAAMRKAAAPQ